MKKIIRNLLALALVAGLVSGCGTLIPKSVEFFQRKVRAVPEVSESSKETQRQAADYVATKTEETKVAAIETHADTNVVSLATDANIVAGALSGSLGPPEDPWKKEALRLALKLKEQQADFNEKMVAYAKHTDKDAGKKIEGTGFIRIPYFVYIGCIALVLFLIWTGLKIYGSINPAVGLGVNSVGRIGSAVLSRGFSEVVKGGEDFKDAIKNSELTAEVKAKILDTFQRHSMQSQSQDVQKVVQTLTVPTVGT